MRPNGNKLELAFFSMENESKACKYLWWNGSGTERVKASKTTAAIKLPVITRRHKFPRFFDTNIDYSR